MSFLSQRREVGQFRGRYRWMTFAVLFVFVVIFARFVQLQFFQYDKYQAIAIDNISQTQSLEAERGVLLDVKGREMATNRPSYVVSVVPAAMSDHVVERFCHYMGFDGGDCDGFRLRLSQIPDRRKRHRVMMFTDLTRSQVAALETHATELADIRVQSVPLRVYPLKELGAHSIGYLNEISAEELALGRQNGMRMGDRVGRVGLEQALEPQLRGRRGRVRRTSPSVLRGVSLREVQEDRTEPEPGKNVRLTLDVDLMRIVKRAFHRHPSGAAVVVEVNTGRVAALFSKPSYDPNEMMLGMSVARYRELSSNPYRPLIDKTVYESYFPGSTFKPFAALAALGDGHVEATQRYTCPGFHEIGNQRLRCTSVHGEVDLRHALVQSCNVYFWELAEQLGLERLNWYAREFGFGKVMGLGINSEASGFLASREWYENRFGRFRLGFTLNTAIGQGNTRATVLQVASAYATLANGGTLYQPQLVEEVRDVKGHVHSGFRPIEVRKVRIRSEHLQEVRRGLVGVVNDAEGTAADARIEGPIQVAGKTGTAQVARQGGRRPSSPSANQGRRGPDLDRDHAWFAGYAPVENPRYAIAVVLEHGGAGGKYAAPVAVRILHDYLSEAP